VVESARTGPRDNVRSVSDRRTSRLADRVARGSASPTQQTSVLTPAAAPTDSANAATSTRSPLDGPHYSTPLNGATQNVDGSYRLTTIQGVNVDLSSDKRDTSLAEKTAETAITPNYVGVQWGPSANGRPSTVTPPSLSFTIETRYGPNANPGDPSGYGRGTTDDDKKTPATTTLGFHEGTHGVAAQQYLRDHPLPVFEGRQGMTVDQLRTLGEQHQAAVAEYVRQMTEEVRRQGDCVGTPADFCPADQPPGAAPSPSPNPGAATP
jgi:hypothetical protein